MVLSSKRFVIINAATQATAKAARLSLDRSHQTTEFFRPHRTHISSSVFCRMYHGLEIVELIETFVPVFIIGFW
jgi:hypothetical protein